jgi:hypothetical protein
MHADRGLVRSLASPSSLRMTRYAAISGSLACRSRAAMTGITSGPSSAFAERYRSEAERKSPPAR